MDAGSVLDSSVVSALQGEGGATARGAGDALRENFMTLLITQLQNQDPLNPMENAEMTSQLAQINTVGGIDALNDTLRSITGQIQTGQSLQAAGLIGKGVLVPGERVLVGEEGASTPFGLELDQPAAQLRARIVDGAGQVVHEFDLEALDAGVHTFSWDGVMTSGQLAPPGSYQVVVHALDEGGSALEPRLLNYALVHGVNTSPKEGVRLDLGAVAGQVRLEDVRQIL